MELHPDIYGNHKRVEIQSTGDVELDDAMAKAHESAGHQVVRTESTEDELANSQERSVEFYRLGSSIEHAIKYDAHHLLPEIMSRADCLLSKGKISEVEHQEIQDVCRGLIDFKQ